MAEIDNLQIKISSDAKTASNAIDRLVNKLETLSSSLGRLDTKGLQKFSSGISILGTSMKSLENVKLPDYTRLAKGIQKFNDIDGAKLGSISNGLRPLADSVRLFSNVNFDNKNLSSFINSITRLANSNLGNLTNVNFSGFTNQMSGLIASLSNAGEVSRYTTNFINSIAKLATVGGNIQIVAQDLPILRSSLLNFVNTMAGAGAVSQETVSFTTAIAQLSNAGDKAAVTAGNLDVLANELKKFFQTISTAPNVSRNIIDMTNALANLANQGSRVGSSSRSIVRGMNNTTSSMNRARKSTTSLAAAFGKFYAKWFLVIRGAKQFMNAIESTADYIEAYNYYNVALGKIASDWNQDWEKYGYENAEAYADSFTERLNASLSKLSGLQIDENQSLLVESGMKNLGLNIQEITQYASQLASVTNSIGQTGEVSIAASSAFTKLAGDISSLFNIDFSSAAQNLQSGLIGQSRALYKYGIDITNATLQTYAYNLGLEKAVSEMTQAEKMQLRMIAILDQSRVSWGDLANTINSPSNMLRQFSNNVKEAGMVLGQLFIPILQKVIPIVNGVVIVIKNLLVSIAKLLGIKLDFGSFGQGYTDLSDGFEDMADSLDGVASSAKKAKAGIREFDELKVINIPDSEGGGRGSAVGGGGFDITDEILKATEEYEKAWQEAYERMLNKAQNIADGIEIVFSHVFENVKNGFNESFQADTSKLENNLTRIEEANQRVFGSPKVQQAIIDYGDQVFRTYGKISGSIASIGTSFSVGLTGGIADAKEELEEFDIEKISSILGNVTKLWESLGNLASSFATIGTAFESDGFSKIIEFFYKLTDITILNGLDLLTGLVSDIFNLFTQPDIENADKYAEALEHIFNIIGNLIEPFGELLDIIVGNSESYENSWIHNLFVGLTDLSSKNKGDILDGINEKLSEMENISVLAGNSMDNLFINVVEKSESVKLKVEELWEKIKEIWSKVSEWFSNNVINPVVNFFIGLKTRVEQIFQGLWIVIQAVWIKVSGWFNDNVVNPVVNFFSPIVDKIGGFFSQLWEVIKAVWGKVSNWFHDTIIHPVTSSFETACDNIGGFFASLWSGIKKGVVGAMNAVIGGIESGINFIVSGINKIIGGFNKIVSWAAKVAEVNWGGVELVPKVSIPRIQGYEIGGFPKPYSLFAAGEGGRAELLGTVGGQTAVAGGAEITGIRDAVWNAHNEEMELMRQQNELLRGILSKEFGITEQQIGKAAANYSRDYMRRTGNPAYSY